MKEISVLLIIVVILAAILGIKIYTSNDNQISIGENKTSVEISEDNNKEYSREEIIKLMESGENCNNYYCSYNDGSYDIIRKYKDNKLIVEYTENGNDNIAYHNYSKNEKIIINKNQKIALISTLDSSTTVPMEIIYYNLELDMLKDNTYMYKFLGKENYNNLDCITVNLDGNKNGNKLSYKIWIHEKTGLVAGYSATSSNGDKEDRNYNLKIDYVTEKDVQKPDLSGYKTQNIN